MVVPRTQSRMGSSAHSRARGGSLPSGPLAGARARSHCSARRRGPMSGRGLDQPLDGMTLTLSPHDQSLVAAATRALVSPLVAPSFEDWLREVNRTLKELLWADKASFVFPLPGGGVRGASDEYTLPTIERY